MNRAFLEAALNHLDASETDFVLCDVGARGKLSEDFDLLYDMGRLHWVGFEPEPVAAAALREKYPTAIISEYGLGAENGAATLHVTREAGCSSVLEPNMGVLAFYPIRSWFEVEKEIEIELRRYDDIVSELELPSIEFLKIDTQGFEFSVLQGMGPHIREALCIELEVHLLPLYKGQGLASDIYQFLFDKGFELISLKQQGRFEGAAIEFNAFFIKRVELLSPDELRKTQVWQMMKGVFRQAASMAPIADTPLFTPEHTAKYLRAGDKTKFAFEADLRSKRAQLLRETSDKPAKEKSKGLSKLRKSLSR